MKLNVSFEESIWKFHFKKIVRVDTFLDSGVKVTIGIVFQYSAECDTRTAQFTGRFPDAGTRIVIENIKIFHDRTFQIYLTQLFLLVVEWR